MFDHPWHAVVADDGTFALEDVPAGRHVLRACHAGFASLSSRTDESAEVSLEVRPGETTSVEVAVGRPR